jgi:hypothetical protein
VTVVVALQAHVRRTAAASRWVYLGEDTAWRIRAERGPLASVERVPTGDRIERLSWELRQPYIDLIGELSGQNASLEWWASELAAKNPFAMLFSRICALACARELLAGGLDDALLVCSTPALVRAVAGAARGAGRSVWVEPGSPADRVREAALARRERVRALIDAVARVAPLRALHTAAERAGPATQALADAPSYRRRLARELGARADGGFAGPDTALLVTWADQRSMGPGGSYRDPHFGTLPEQLEGAGYRVAYLPRVLPYAPVRQVLAGLTRSGARLFVPELWISSADWRDAKGRVRRFQPAILEAAAVEGVPVAELAHEQVERYRYAQAWSLAHAPLVRNLAAAGVRPELVILPFEGHAWEQVVTAAVHEHMPGATVIGYDNVNFSRLALSLYPARSELALRPLPDVVVTNGEAFERILTREGFPSERVRVGCGLRHEYVWAERPPSVARPEGLPVRVLVATSIDPGQSVELIEKAVAAFGGEGFELTVKLHPAVDPAAVMAWLSPSARSARFSDEPIDRLLGSADMMLYTYSVVCYEALAQGVPPVFVKAETFLDLDQLEPFPQLGRRARTVDELRAAAAEISAQSEAERRRWREQAREALAQALRPVTADCVRAFVTP